MEQARKKKPICFSELTKNLERENIMDLSKSAKPPIKASKTTYGWILKDADGNAAENLTRTYKLPFYRSVDRANEAAENANRIANIRGEKECP